MKGEYQNYTKERKEYILDARRKHGEELHVQDLGINSTFE
jgi:hypothetical protein